MPAIKPLSALITALALAPLAVGAVEFAPTINAQYDVVNYNDDVTPLVDGDDFRRLRGGFKLGFGEGFELKAEFDFDSDVWTDAYLEYQREGFGSLKVGQFKQPFGLEELTSSKVIPFMERSLASQTGIVRRIGVQYARPIGPTELEISAFGQNLTGDDAGEGQAVRWTGIVGKTETGGFHWGVALVTERPDSESARFRARPEARINAPRLIDSGTLGNVDRVDRLGVEGAWLQGPWSVTGEYLHARATRDGGTDFDAPGGYVAVNWFPTGHARRFKGTAIDGPKLGDSEWAVELGLRGSVLDLRDAGIDGGREQNLTLGATLYFGKHFRLMANHVRANIDRAGRDESPDLTEFRAQFNW